MKTVHWTALFVASLVCGAPARAQETSLQDCLGDGTVACYDSTAILLDESCGGRFYNYRGRVAWPLLRNVGPIVISATTRWLPDRTPFPLYIEVVSYQVPYCTPDVAGTVVMAVQGARQCGGTTDIVGPLDLTSLARIGLGELYYVQAVFFQTLAATPTRYTVPMSCITIEPAPTALTQRAWTAVKALYR
jgi:hypothetical protein